MPYIPRRKRDIRYDPSGAAREPRKLTPAQRRFADELLATATMDAGEAALRAGYPKASYGSVLLSLPHVRRSIQQRATDRANRMQIDQDYMLRRWFAALQVDMREFTELWRVPCRHCWGVDHLPQFNDVELRAERQAHMIAQMKIRNPKDRHEFDELGGGGYTINRRPMRGPDYVEFVVNLAMAQGTTMPIVEANSDHSCPNCYGHGIEHRIYHDSRDLSPAAAILYRGVKETRDGFEVMIRDQSEFDTMVAKHLGMWIERKAILIEDVRKLSDDELNDAIAAELRAIAGAPLIEVAAGGDAIEAENGAGAAA